MMIAAYLSKQCAALTSQRSLMIEAPQVWRPWNLRLTCHGSSPCRASSPPTTRLPIAGRVPQAAGESRIMWSIWRYVSNLTVTIFPVSGSITLLQFVVTMQTSNQLTAEKENGTMRLRRKIHHSELHQIRLHSRG